jgi:hypothetical protein
VPPLAQQERLHYTEASQGTRRTSTETTMELPASLILAGRRVLMMKAFFLPLCLGLGLIAPPATAQSLSGQADVVDGDTLAIRGEKTRVPRELIDQESY